MLIISLFIIFLGAILTLTSYKNVAAIFIVLGIIVFIISIVGFYAFPSKKKHKGKVSEKTE